MQPWALNYVPQFLKQWLNVYGWAAMWRRRYDCRQYFSSFKFSSFKFFYFVPFVILNFLSVIFFFTVITPTQFGNKNTIFTICRLIALVGVKMMKSLIFLESKNFSLIILFFNNFFFSYLRWNQQTHEFYSDYFK